MLGKLLKYDLKYMIKNMSIFYILAVFFSILTRIFFSIEQTIIVNVIGQITCGCMFSMVASIVFNTVIRSWVRFKDSIYRDESYLTHTLPVTKKEIYSSRFLQSLIFLIIGFIASVVSLFIAYYTKDRWIFIKDTVNSISQGLNLNTGFVVSSIIIVFFLEIFNILQSGFLGLIIGNKRNNNKIAFSFLFGFIAYMVSQTFVVLFLFVVGLFNSNVMTIFTSSSMINNNVIELLIVLAILTYTLLITLMAIICGKELSKGVNVE